MTNHIHKSGPLFCAVAMSLMANQLNAEDRFSKEMVAGIVLADKPGISKEECYRIIEDNPKLTPGKDYSLQEVKIIRNKLSNPEQEAKKPFWGIKVRQDYNDVTGEDPTVAEPKERRDQLAGASFSYARDFNGKDNSWAVQGALIRPFKVYENMEGASASDPPLILREAFLVPSVSLHKVTGGEGTDDDVDSLIYRLGAVGRFSGVSQDAIREIELRGFATYATDVSHDASTIAGEFDLEPRIGGRREDAKWALGFPASLDGRPPGDGDGNSNLHYHLRTYVHGEFGEVEDTGGNADLVEGSFFRLGPVAKFELVPSGLARALGKKQDGIKFYTSYSFLPTVSGNDNGHDFLFSAGLDWSLLEKDDQSVSLKVLFEKGGMEITKEEVETLTVGLGVTF